MTHIPDLQEASKVPEFMDAFLNDWRSSGTCRATNTGWAQLLVRRCNPGFTIRHRTRVILQNDGNVLESQERARGGHPRSQDESNGFLADSMR